MTRTPGRMLMLEDTGHSIHDERPVFLAREIVRFLGL
jgi:pimeloyl-ACP methyl ester carboxylesterase